MFVSKPFLELFAINWSTVDSLRTKVAELQGKNELLERELTAIRVNSDWMRMRVNQLEIERSALLEKAYPGLHIPTPEIARVSNKVREAFDLASMFEDTGDEERMLPTS